MKELYNRYSEMVLYLLYGIPPTIVSFGCYSLLVQICKWDAAVSNLLSWIISVILGFFLYRRFVFPAEEVQQPFFKELAKFFGMRTGTGAIETALVWLFVSFLGFNPFLFKALAGCVSIVLNYAISKYLVFRNKKIETKDNSEIKTAPLS